MRDDLASRIDALDWPAIERALDAQGFAPFGPVLTREECAALAAMYGDETRFRSRIDMARFRFGVGDYKYFGDPLPEIVRTLGSTLYAHLAPTANRWAAALDPAALKGARSAVLPGARFPAALDDFLARCHVAGQRRPTPLLLSYPPGGYNCLHQDIYGEVAFPVQVVFGLGRPDVDYQGGELLLVEQRPRAQSRGHAVGIRQGAAVVFATRERPAAGARGSYRVVMRHGVSTITAGARMSLGIIFHDAK